MKNNLPPEILLKILKNVDQQTKYQLGLTCSAFSKYALQQLWKVPIITDLAKLNMFASTLDVDKPLHQYRSWVKMLTIINSSDDDYVVIPDNIFLSITSLSLKSLVLQKIDIPQENSSRSPLESFLSQQLNQGVTEIHIHQCASLVINYLIRAIRLDIRHSLEKLCISECNILDRQTKEIVEFCPNIKSLKLNGCGCFSDTGLIAIAKHCKKLRLLMVTLPASIFQSNTITTNTLDALELHCPKLKRFICTGQTRIQKQYLTDKNYTFDIITS